MPRKRDIAYEITPQSVDVGQRWITVRIQNKSDKTMTNLDVRLNSQDTFGLEVIEPYRFVPVLNSGEEQYFYFRISASLTTGVYLSIVGEKNSLPFYWEMPTQYIRISEEPAELLSLFAVSEPRVILGTTITCEAAVKSFTPTKDLIVDVWTEGPDGLIEDLDSIKTGDLEAGQTKVFSTQFKPDKTGVYTVHAELYDGVRRLGKQIDYVTIIEK